METYTVRSERFPDLDHRDLALYAELSEALRNFEFVAAYNFRGMTPEARAEFVPAIIKHLNKVYKKVFPSFDGKVDCGPLCPGVRSCYMCKWMIEHSSSEVEGPGPSE